MNYNIDISYGQQPLQNEYLPVTSKPTTVEIAPANQTAVEVTPMNLEQPIQPMMVPPINPVMVVNPPVAYIPQPVNQVPACTEY